MLLIGVNLLAEEMQRIEERFASKEAEFSELERKYAVMEQQYLETIDALEGLKNA